VPCEGSRLMLSPEEVVKRCDSNTVGVVLTLGTTYTLEYEPVRAVSTALDDLAERSGLDIPIHVDAASGGFIAPFIHPSVIWDFRVPRVRSINASGHKFGLAPLGCGWIVWRGPDDLPEELIFRVKYLGGNLPTFALNFSRPGGQIASQYYNIVRLGHDGYRRINQGCADVAAWFADEIDKLDCFDLVYDGRGGVPGCVWTLRTRSRFSLYDLAERLRIKGWQVPAYPLPQRRTDLVVQRIVGRLGFSRNLAELLVDDLQRAVRSLERRGGTRQLTRASAGGYYHN